MFHFSPLLGSLLLPLLLFIASARAWGQCGGFADKFQTELQNEGLTELANIVTEINQTSTGQALLSQISLGNYTFFAPTNEAVQNVSSQVSGNATLLAEYLSYHFVHGDFQNVSYTNTSAGGASGGATSSTESSTSSVESSPSASPASTTETTTSATSEAPSSTVTVTATAALFGRLFGESWSNDGSGPSNASSNLQLDSGVYPNNTLGRTLLNSTEFVMLPGNRSQVLAWTRNGENGNVSILNQITNVTVVGATRWRNLFINRIDGVLIPPGNISTALNATNATAASNLLSSVQVPSLNGTNETVVELLQEARGITVFVPNNDAFTSEVNQTLDSLQNNELLLTALIANHYVNGTVLYSPILSALGSSNISPNVTSAAGEPLQFTTNDTGIFVQGPSGSGAQIVRADVLINNGVIHIIDRVLVTNESDPAAATSAYESATSAAATSTTETAPIGESTTMSEASSSSIGSTVTVTASSAVRGRVI